MGTLMGLGGTVTPNVSMGFVVDTNGRLFLLFFTGDEPRIDLPCGLMVVMFVCNLSLCDEDGRLTRDERRYDAANCLLGLIWRSGED